MAEKLLPTVEHQHTDPVDNVADQASDQIGDGDRRDERPVDRVVVHGASAESGAQTITPQDNAGDSADHWLGQLEAEVDRLRLRVAQLAYQRRLLARLASPVARFFNPFARLAAEQLRDAILAPPPAPPAGTSADGGRPCSSGHVDELAGAGSLHAGGRL